MNKSKINITYKSAKLKFRFPFKIAHGMRTHTDVVLVCAECNGLRGYGEATLPPYLPDTVESVISFLNNNEIQELSFPADEGSFFAEKIFDVIDAEYAGNMPAKAALDMALWQLQAQMQNKTLAELLGVKSNKDVPHTYTIGIGTRPQMREKIDFAIANGFICFKLKMNGENDENILNDYLALCSQPFAIDANQGWKDLQEAINFSLMLQKHGCILIEQPFEKYDTEKSNTLKDALAIPLIADEACQRLVDIEKIKKSFSGINIKLQKCGGITEAMRMIEKANSLGLKTLIGCMSESSIGCNAAEALSPLCNWADLDGPWLIENDREIFDLLVD